MVEGLSLLARRGSSVNRLHVLDRLHLGIHRTIKVLHAEKSIRVFFLLHIGALIEPVSARLMC